MAMNVDLMKQLDERLGPWLVRGSRWVRWLERGCPERPRDPRRILAMKFWGLGSLVQATASFRALRQRYPEAELDLLTIRGNERLFAGQDLFNHVWTIDLNRLPNFLWQSCSRLAAIRRRRYDLLLNFEGYARYGMILSHLSGAGCCIEYRTPRSGRADVEVEFREGRHIAEVFGDLVAAVDARPDDLEPRLELPPESRRMLSRWREQFGIDPADKVVALNVNAGPISPARRWPRERFLELGRLLLEQPGLRVVLIGGPDEVPYVTPVADGLGPGAMNLAGRTSLAELLGVLAGVDLLVTNDSGPLHLAVALGTPTLSFFGPESPRIYGPRGPQHTILYLDLPCSPCLTFANLKRTACDHFSCLREITVEQAWQAARRSLEGLPPLPPGPQGAELVTLDLAQPSAEAAPWKNPSPEAL